MNGLYTPGKIRTFTGKFVDPFNLRPEDICIEDIAHALSHQCRFAGHTQLFYSVAQHSIRVMVPLTIELKIYGLLHDASEAYLMDLPTPIKHQLPEYKAAEDRAMLAIAQAFDLHPAGFSHPSVKESDRMQLEREWQEVVLKPDLDNLQPHQAKMMFTYWFNQLTR